MRTGLLLFWPHLFVPRGVAVEILQPQELAWLIPCRWLGEGVLAEWEEIVWCGLVVGKPQKEKEEKNPKKLCSIEKFTAWKIFLWPYILCFTWLLCGNASEGDGCDECKGDSTSTCNKCNYHIQASICIHVCVCVCVREFMGSSCTFSTDIYRRFWYKGYQGLDWLLSRKVAHFDLQVWCPSLTHFQL